MCLQSGEKRGIRLFLYVKLGKKQEIEGETKKRDEVPYIHFRVFSPLFSPQFTSNPRGVNPIILDT